MKRVHVTFDYEPTAYFLDDDFLESNDFVTNRIHELLFDLFIHDLICDFTNFKSKVVEV